jgi:hypothetical protein
MYRHAPHQANDRRINVSTIASAARRWWPVVVTMALLGGLLGVAASSNPTYTSTALVRILSLTPDGQGFENAQQTALLLMQTDEVFQRAAEIVGEDSAALRSRTAVTRVTETDLLEIEVAGKSQAQTVREAGSIASAGRELMQDLSKDQVAQAALSSDRAIVSGVLPNGAAELARQQELGKAAGTRQDVGLATALSLSPVGTPQSTRAGLPRSIAVAIGILVGLLLGIAGAWLYGRRFGRLRRVGDVRTALPNAGVIDGGRLAGVAHRYSERSKSLISVLALTEAAPALRELTSTLEAELRTEGRKPYTLQTSDLRVGQAGRAAADGVGEAHVANGRPIVDADGTSTPGVSADAGQTSTAVAASSPTSDANSTSAEGPTSDSGDGPAPSGSPDASPSLVPSGSPVSSSSPTVSAAPAPTSSPRFRPSPRPRPRPAITSEVPVASEASPTLTAVVESANREKPVESVNGQQSVESTDEQHPAVSTNMQQAAESSSRQPVEANDEQEAVASSNGQPHAVSSNGHQKAAASSNGQQVNGHEAAGSTNGRAALTPTNGHKATARFIPAIGRQRDRDLDAVGCDTLLVSGEWEPDVAARLADRADVVLLIAKQGRTRLHDLAAAGRELGDTDVVVVVT